MRDFIVYKFGLSSPLFMTYHIYMHIIISHRIPLLLILLSLLVLYLCIHLVDIHYIYVLLESPPNISDMFISLFA